jgi:hypothetical protein
MTPEQWERKREKYRINEKLREGYDDSIASRLKEKLPAGPLIAYVDELIRAHGSSATGTALQIDESRIRRIAGGITEDGRQLKHVTLTLLDKIAINSGRPELIHELYGSTVAKSVSNKGKKYLSG